MPRDWFQVRVECHAGYRGEEYPRRFWFGDREIAVADILDRWLAPDHRYFKLRATNGDLYILRHEEETDQWTLVFHAARGSDGK